jgi:ureidoglycolate lyase
MTAVRVPVRPLTAEAFAPYGEVWQSNERPADRRVDQHTGFAHEGQAIVRVIWQPARGLTFTRLERHFAVTQGFVHMGGAPAVVCVAAPTATDNAADVPDPASVVGFRFEAGQGFAYHRGTWHALDRYLLGQPGASFLIINSAPNPTQMVDYGSGVAEDYRDLGNSQPRRRQLPGTFDIRFEIDTAGHP